MTLLQAFEDALRKIVREEIEAALARQASPPVLFPYYPMVWPVRPYSDGVTVACPFCDQANCNQTHVTCGDPPGTSGGAGGTASPVPFFGR